MSSAACRKLLSKQQQLGGQVPSPSYARRRHVWECNAGVKLPSFPELTVHAKYATEHRCGIAVSGPGLTDNISGTDPLKDNLPLQVSQQHILVC